MAEIRLNKTELKNQKTLLDQLSKYLPTLQLKKQQLQVEVEVAKTLLDRFLSNFEEIKKGVSQWYILFSQQLSLNLMQFAEIESVISERENVAGVDVPAFRDVQFKKYDYSYFTTPLWFDRAIEEIRKLLFLREEMKILKQKLKLLEEELRQTNIKVNLFEKRMIPECKENIRKIKIFLGDQEIAAICNAKIAKDKLKRKEMAESERAS